MAEKSARPRLSASLRSANPILRTTGRVRIDSAPIKTCGCAMVVPPDRPGVVTPGAVSSHRSRRAATSDSFNAARRNPFGAKFKGAAIQIRAALRRGLIEADAGVLDDLDPFVVFRGHERLEPVWRKLDHVAAVLLEARLELGQRLRDLPLQACDRGWWRFGGGEQSDPGIDLEVGDAGLGHGRHVGHLRAPLRG